MHVSQTCGKPAGICTSLYLWLIGGMGTDEDVSSKQITSGQKTKLRTGRDLGCMSLLQDFSWWWGNLHWEHLLLCSKELKSRAVCFCPRGQEGDEACGGSRWPLRQVSM